MTEGQKQMYQEAFDECSTVDAAFSKYSIYHDEPKYRKWKIVATHHRDSDNLEESNWDAMLELLGGESSTVYILRASHWGVGWVEYMCVSPRAWKKALIAGQALCSLDNYPVLDDEDFCRREFEEEMEEQQQIRQEHYNDFHFEDPVYGTVRADENDIYTLLEKKLKAISPYLCEEEWDEALREFSSEETALELWSMLYEPTQWVAFSTGELEDFDHTDIQAIARDLLSVFLKQAEKESGQLILIA